MSIFKNILNETKLNEENLILVFKKDFDDNMWDEIIGGLDDLNYEADKDYEFIMDGELPHAIEILNDEILNDDETLEFIRNFEDSEYNESIDKIIEMKAKFKKIMDPITKKKVGKWYCDSGMKLDRSGTKPQCKKATAQDKQARIKAAKRAAKTRSMDKVGIAKANKQRALTNKLKKNVGL